MLVLENSAQSTGAEVRMAAEVRATAVCNEFAAGTDSPSTIETTFEDMGANVGFDHFNTPENFDWTNDSVQRRFASLERKVGRSAATKEETSLYSSMLISRRRSVFADCYMREYAEIERLRAVRKKLRELQELLQPVAL